MDFEHKYNKYKSKYLQLKTLLSTYEGSGFLKKNMSGGSKKEKENNNTLKVKCVEVYQDDEEHKFKGIMCKTPPIKIRFKTDEIKTAFLVKSLLRLVNKSLRIKFVKKVEIIEGKKTKEYTGDKLSDNIKISEQGVIDKIIIKF